MDRISQIFSVIRQKISIYVSSKTLFLLKKMCNIYKHVKSYKNKRFTLKNLDKIIDLVDCRSINYSY